MDRQNEILGRVEQFYRLHRLLGSRQQPLHLAAAVSGGADSMALLGILCALQPEFGFTLSACHVNHGLRGETADRDEVFVTESCRALGVPLQVFHALDMAEQVGTVPPHAGEDWARRLRYACFARLLEQGIDAVATAHTENDQAETLLLRLARGTGLHGAAGIRPSRRGYCRPLLCLGRQDTEAFCRETGLLWVTDETNDTDAYARNRLRSGAIPALRSTNSAAVENLARFCEKAAQADAYFARQAQLLLTRAQLEMPCKQLPAGARYALAQGNRVWHLPPLAQAELLILETAMHSLLAPVRDPEEKYVQLLCDLVGQGSGAVQLTSRVRFCAEQGVLWQEEIFPAAPAAPAAPQAFLPRDGAEYRLSGGWKLTVRVKERDFEEKKQVVHKKDLKNQADYARIAMCYPDLCLRSRLPGDRYRPPGRDVDKELRKWMNEAGIPPCDRDGLPVLASGSRVLWVGGTGFAQGLAPAADCTRILLMELEKTEEIKS